MDSNKMTIGERIKQRRESLGLTQRELSERLFVKRETINQWESGTRQIKGDDIARLADTLETTCDYILRGVETEQLHLFKDLGLTGQAVKRLKVMAADCRGGNDALNSLIGNELFSLFVGRWYDYCVLAENLNQTKIELIRALADANVKLVSKQLSDDDCTILAYNQIKVPASQTCKNVAILFIERQDKKEYIQFKLQQVINAMLKNYDELLTNRKK